MDAWIGVQVDKRVVLIVDKHMGKWLVEWMGEWMMDTWMDG